MMYASTITKTGQATIPKDVREALGVHFGERIYFTVNRDKTVSVAREMTEQEARAYLDSFNTEETRRLIKLHAGKTVSELREEWDKSPAGRAYYREKYDIR